MNQTRVFLLVALAIVGYLIVMKWEADFSVRPQAAPTPVSAQASDLPTLPGVGDGSDLPALPDLPEPTMQAADPAAPTEPEAPASVQVTTDVLDLTISLRGATVSRATLRQFPVDSRQPDHKVQLLADDATHWHVAQDGLRARRGELPTHESLYTSPRKSYQLGNRPQLEVPFEWRSESGVTVRKTFVLTPGSYVIEVRHDLVNGSDSALAWHPYRQLQRVVPPQRESGFFLSNPETYAYVGAAMWSREKHFEKLDFGDFATAPLKREVIGGWSAMLQHHFLTAWIPPAGELSTFATTRLPPGGGFGERFVVSQTDALIQAAPGDSHRTVQRLYVGPKDQRRLATITPGFDLAVDYGFFTFLSKPLFWLMNWFHDLVGNWGVAIILLTLLVRLAMYKLSEAQYRSGAKMRKLQPKLLALQERYADDKQQLAIKQMELFKQEKANPMSGCLPVLLQIPVFIALYWVIFESVELRQAPFALWIRDLTAPDPYFVLPVLNGVVMWVTTKLSPTPLNDPVQKMVFQIMPVMFAFLFALFPSGLVLYWTVNGALGLVQQIWITRRIEREDQRRG